MRHVRASAPELHFDHETAATANPAQYRKQARHTIPTARASSLSTGLILAIYVACIA